MTGTSSRSAGMKDETLDEKKPMTAGEEAWDIAKTVLIAVAVTLFVRFFLFQPFNIPSGSMKPTLAVGDFIIVDKIDYGYSKASLIYPLTRLPGEGRLFADTPERGEVVVFKNQNDRNRDYIKRVIGLPGDTVQVMHGRLYVNGQQLARTPVEGEPDCDGYPGGQLYRETNTDGVSYVIQECRGDDYEYDRTPLITVPDGNFFMMGDNRDNSLDSRTPTVRFVPEHQLVGRATRIAFSVDGDKSRLWQVWKWPGAIRYGRIGDKVE
ncbi:signal peptidase I [Parvularcula dongshanensis]|uniref:Signal peptidase I n=1 Tax=Parvularcula dongshanensis TaxID=1173995 RepID=A0A840I2F9_9PROT|nr:signal peptidase I [Parvularcula dongshanensis]MBB4658378.1 signal peptidase I [Parvularcula dongshanensis]